MQALAQYNEEMQQLSRELAHSLLASSYARDLGLPIGQGLYSPGLGNTITIWNGPRFPFDRPVWLKIGSALVRGRFKHKSNAHEGVSEFKVSETVHPLTCDFTGRHCTELDSERLRLFPTVEYGKYTSLANQKLREWGEANDLPSDITDPQQTDKSVLIPTMLDWLKRAAPNKVSQFRLSLGQYEDVQVTGQRAGFHWVNSGSPVRLAYGNPIEFVLSIVPCRLIRLAAYRTYAGQRHLTTVPPEWYTIEQQDYGDGLVATVVVLQRPLDTIANANFEAQLYATVESDIGPNVVDVIRYLVEKYLPNATCDDTTFNQVKAEVDIWPVNFALLDRYNILELLSTICYQACIGIWFSEGVVRLRYLPNMPEQTTDLTESNIDTESLRINYTPTEDITTKIVATYLPSYDVDRPTRLAARYNISKYGVTEQNIDYLIYNDREAVVHSLTFWLIRTANTWKYLEFTTALDTLIFETMDAITVKLPGDFCANGPVTGIVEQVEYDSLQFTLRYRVWLPVRAGEMETYKFAYYNIGDIDDEFPEPQDWATGNGLGPPLIRQWKTGGRGPRYMGFTAEYLSDIPELQPMQAPVMLQPKKPRRRYAAESESESGTGFPDFSPVIGGYGDPQLPSSPEINLPSISGDTTPEDGPSEAGFLPDGPFDSPRSADPTGTTLSLSRTLILDERSGEFAVLSSFFKGVRNNRLSISSKLPVIDDEDRAGIFEMLHVPGTTDFAAKLAYLAEDG